MTQEELAKKAHVSVSSISRYEMGSLTPSLDACLSMAETLDCSLDALLARVPIGERTNH
jgi:DNA-binding XRE family transcriptional regulator